MRYLGKFRGVVTAVDDPLRLGRVQVSVPEVAEGSPQWAMPCMPVAGRDVAVLVTPAVGDSVWVEFEQGEAHRPIWVGAFWTSSADLPVADCRPGITWASRGGLSLRFTDSPEGATVFEVTTAAGATLRVSDSQTSLVSARGAVTQRDERGGAQPLT
jgi:uncharacterized protein involved in type VI secretion and phage assembly